jgi:hypothetical protein
MTHMARFAIVDETTNKVVSISDEDPNALHTLGGALVRVPDPDGTAVIDGAPPVQPPPRPAPEPTVVAEPDPAATAQMDRGVDEEPVVAAPGAVEVAVDAEAAPTHPTEPHPSDSSWKIDP